MKDQMAKEIENGMCCFSLEDYALHSVVAVAFDGSWIAYMKKVGEAKNYPKTGHNLH